MLEVRRVRIEDVTLRGIYNSELGKPEEADAAVTGVLLKAETHQPTLRPDLARTTLDWASLHMNLDAANSQPPGKELYLAVLDHPEGNAFRAEVGIGDSIGYKGRLLEQRRGRVNLVGPEGYSFILSGEAKDGSKDTNVVFDRKQARAFVQLLAYWWMRPED